MANVIAKIQLNPSYSSWQDRHNGIYLTQQASQNQADVTSDMRLEFIKNALRHKIISVVEGYIDINQGASKYELNDRKFFDTSWYQNQIILGPDGTSVSGIQIGNETYEFKGDLVEPGPPGPPGETPSIDHLEQKIDAKLEEFEERFGNLEAGNNPEVVDARESIDGQQHATLSERLRYDFENIDVGDPQEVIDARVATDGSRHTTLSNRLTYDFANIDVGDPEEVVDARVAIDGSIHENLSERLKHDFKNLDIKDIKLLRNVNNYSEMEALKDVEDGCLCYVKNDDKYYKYNDGLWSVFEGGGGSGGGASTEVTLTSQSPTEIRIALGKEVILNYTYATTGKIKNGRAVYTVNDIDVKTDKITEGSISFNPTNYLKSGNNTIEIQVTDTYGAKDFLVYEIDCVNLEITSTFNHAIIYSGEIPFIYNAKGNISKTVHFKIDKREIGTEVVETNNVSKTYMIPKQSHGVHELEVYMTCEIEQETLTSNTLRYEFISIEEGQSAILISSSFSITEVDQYTALKIPYIVYNPASLTSDVELLINNSPFASVSVDRKEQVWSLTDYPTGAVTFSIKCGTVKKDFVVQVNPVEIDIVAKEEGLQLYLTSTNRINDDNKEDWSYEGIAAEFNGFNWITDGWQTDKNGVNVMRVSGDANITIPLKLFEEDFKTLGKTIEFEFAVRDVSDYDAKIISCISDGRGLEVGCKNAEFHSNEIDLKVQYKEDERVRISFSVQNHRDERLIFIYLDGVISGLARYTTQDVFSQINPVNITIGSNQCTLDLYNIRVYQNSLTFMEALHNYIADMNDPERKIELFSRNNVFNEYGEISYNKLLTQLPCMTLIGELPPVKGSKRYIKIKYEDQADPSRNFNDTNVKIDVQGTSSQYYPKKNYKFTLNFPYMLRTGSIPEKVYCVKADYMESSHMHNTGMAKIVHAMYDEPVPPQEENSKVRTTIDGFPIAMFYRAKDDAPLQYFGIYNFNNDKSDVTTFGYSGSAESWEICNNTSDRTLFKRSDYETIGVDGKPEWQNDFEARYPEDNLEYTNLKRLTDWIASTKDDSAKFKREFNDYFNLHYVTIYYILTELFAMVDSRAKNMFLSTWDTQIWYPVFYDMDTCFGLNNEGVLAFDYNVESRDSIGSQNVYNGKDSVMWKNFEKEFAKEIEKTYNDLRDSGKLSYEGILNFLLEEQFNPICEAQYNEDAAYKYLDPLLNDRIETYLYIAQGNRLNHLKYWLFNRFNYMDSRYIAADYKDNYATFRLYTPSSWSGVRPSADFEITPYASQYVSVKFGSYLVRERGEYNQPTTITAPDIVFNDTETIIYGASRLSSIGDISNKYAGTVDVSKATQLKELIVGSNKSGYRNTNLHNVSVGNNKLLRKIDVSNCPNLTQALELSECDAIEEVYAKGTAISTVKLPPGGTIKIMHLPDSVTSLTLKNKPNIADLSLKPTNLNTLITENTNFNPFSLLGAARQLEFIRFMNLDCVAASDLIRKLEGYKGLDEYGDEIPIGEAISGIIHIPACSEELKREFEEKYPNVEFIIDSLVETYTVTFLDGDGEVIGTQKVIHGGAAEYIGPAPTKTPTVQYRYEWNGWDRPLKPITADTTIQATFESIIQIYTITFMNSDTNTVISTQQVEYNHYPEEPDLPEGHNDWVPTLAKAERDVVYKSAVVLQPDDLSIFKFTYDRNADAYTASLAKEVTLKVLVYPNRYNKKTVYRITKEDQWTSNETIEEVVIPDGVKVIGEHCFHSFNKLKSVKLHEGITKLEDYAFAYCEMLEEVNIPSTVTELSADLFASCKLLSSPMIIPKGVTILPSNLFYFCESLPSVTILGEVTFIGQGCFKYCSVLKTLNIPNTVTDIKREAFSSCSIIDGIDLSRLKLTKITERCFEYCKALKSITIPDTVTTIELQAFYYCTSLSSITMSKNVKSIDNNAFKKCAFESIEIPENMDSIGTYAFTETNLTRFVFPKNINVVPVGMFSGCSNLSEIVLHDNITTFTERCFLGTALTQPLYPKNLRTLEDYVYSGCQLMQEIGNLEQIDTLGTGIFSDCTSLTDVTWPLKFTAIPNSMFSGCTGLMTINIPEGITTIGEQTFAETGMTSIKLPDTIENIGQRAFRKSNIQSFSFPPLITTVVPYMFSESKLVNVALHDNITVIEANAFSLCRQLTNVTLSKNLTTIESKAFESTDSLEEITLPESLTELSPLCFTRSGLTGIVIPTKVTVIPDSAFYRCTKLRNLSITGPLEIIKQSAFEDTSLLTINLPETTTVIENSAFSSVYANEINAPGVKTIGTYCFSRYASNNNSMNITLGGVRSAVESIGDNALRYLIGTTIIYTQNGSPSDISGSPWGATSRMNFEYKAINK